MSGPLKQKRLFNTRTRKLCRSILARQQAPVPIQKHHLEEVLRTLKKRETTKTKEKIKLHRLTEDFGHTGEEALAMCHSPSLDVIQPKFKFVHSYSSHFLFNSIRKAILMHDWPHVLNLLSEVLKLNQLTKLMLPYIFRVMNICMFNQRMTPEEMDHYIKITLGIKKENDQIDYLKSLFILPKSLELGKRVNNRLIEERSKLIDLVDTDEEMNPSNIEVDQETILNEVI